MLFLGFHDLRNLLITASDSRHENLQIHALLDCLFPAMGRNLILLDTVSSQDFDPADEEDMDYIWDLWTSATWSASTTVKFFDHIKNLVDAQPLERNNIFISGGNHWQKKLKSMWVNWIDFVLKSPVSEILTDRYISI